MFANIITAMLQSGDYRKYSNYYGSGRNNPFDVYIKGLLIYIYIIFNSWFYKLAK
jgi:hypothetical protein